MKRLSCLLIVTLLFCLFFTEIIAQENEETVITNVDFILDASNSMNEKVGTEPKIDVAKRVLLNLIETWVSESTVTLNIGLRVYGNNFDPTRSKDIACQDTTLEVSVKDQQIEEIKTRVNQIVAKGYTPIAYSLLQTKGDFSGMDGENNVVILVSDGKESCGGDPCAVAKELNQSGISVKINVIGFDVTDQEKAQLECVANAAEGKYYTAKNASELKSVIEAVKQKVIDEEKVIKERKKQETQKKTSSRRIKLQGPGKLQMKETDYTDPPKMWYAYDSESGEKKQQVADAWGTVNLPSGKYNLTMRIDGYGAIETPLTDEPVEIKSGETTVFELNTGVNIIGPDWAPVPEWIVFADPETGKKKLNLNKRLGSILIAPGEYDVLIEPDLYNARAANFFPDKKFVVEKGVMKDLQLFSGIAPNVADWVPVPEYWKVRSASDNKVVQQMSKTWQGAIIPPGNYKVTVDPEGYGTKEMDMTPGKVLEVKEGERLDLDINSGISFIVEADRATPEWIRFYDSETGDLVQQINKAWGTHLLPPGVYRITIEQQGYGSMESDLGDGIEVRPGELLEIEL